MREIEYQFGDMLAVYLVSPEDNVSLLLLPAACAQLRRRPWETPDSFSLTARYNHQWRMGYLVQMALAHQYRGTGIGSTMKYGGGTCGLKLKEQKTEQCGDETRVLTVLSSPEGYVVNHLLVWRKGSPGLVSSCEFVNGSPDAVCLDMLSSFSLDNLSPFHEDDAPGAMALHRFQSRWSLEGKHVCEDFEELSMEKAYSFAFHEGLRFGANGLMNVSGYFPTAAVEDKAYGVIWAARLVHNGSWQMELTRNGDQVSLSGGQADYEQGMWRKNIEPGGRFQSPRSYLTVVQGNIDDACARLTELQKPAWEAFGEEGLPICFNEFCSTWGDPDQEKMLHYAQCLSSEHVRYLVIDAGWSRDCRGGQYGNGEWLPDTRRFPDMKAMCRQIRQEGFIPGIWFEFEASTQGSATFAPAYDHMKLKDGGTAINTAGWRTFWDFRNPETRQFLRERVIHFLRDNGFGYIKVDYNGNIGVGCDGAESPGEGLRQHAQAVAEFFREIKREIPDIIIENCASGGHRSEPMMMGLSALTSFSDAHEAVEIPYIAANMHRLMLPAQSLIWAVLRKEDSLKRIAYSLSAGFLGRICLSGDLDKLSPVQQEVLDQGLEFYRLAQDIIKNGKSRIYGKRGRNMRYPQGTQLVLRQWGNKILAVLHSFERPEKNVRVMLPYPVHIRAEFCNSAIRAAGSTLVVSTEEEFMGCAVILEKAD